jgi:hypothetical protein
VTNSGDNHTPIDGLSLIQQKDKPRLAVTASQCWTTEKARP